jgi:hypothetical protein
MLTISRHLYLFRVRLIHSMPSHLISLRSTLIWSSIYAYVFQVVSFLQVSSRKPSTHFYFSPYVFTFRCRLDLIILLRNVVEVHVMTLYAVSSSFMLGTNTFHSILFSNILNLCSFITVTDQIWHPHKTNEVVIPYILIFTFVDSKRERQKFLDWMEAGLPPLKNPSQARDAG